MRHGTINAKAGDAGGDDRNHEDDEVACAAVHLNSFTSERTLVSCGYEQVSAAFSLRMADVAFELARAERGFPEEAMIGPTKRY